MKEVRLSVSTTNRPVDPLEIFNKLTLRGDIEGIWEPQAKALRDWHSSRAERDVVIEMNTGGGKTLVGLLMAQSVVNETHGCVLYVCPNNQLVEQAAERASQIGLTPGLRYKGDWSNRARFDEGETFCVTNYASLFNGKSVFRDHNVNAIILDDAHVAESTIRGCFTLRLPHEHPGKVGILNLLRKHFANSGQSTTFQEICEGRHSSILFAPMFVVWQHADEIRKLLLDAGVAEDQETLFAWQHIKDHLNHCCILASSGAVEITPPLVPCSALKFFAECDRRIYLTATLPSHPSFARTFGITNPVLVSPSGKSGAAQKLVVFVPGADVEQHEIAAKSLVSSNKSCVISPSYSQIESWVPPAKIYERTHGQEEIERFANSDDAEMLGLVARYDGIDLPGESCRLLILHGLPTGECLIDRFIDESVRVETIRTANTATRVVQAIGRIFRSNTDHGVVLLVDPALQAWVRSPYNRAYLPPLLQQQLQLSNELGKQVDAGVHTWDELIDGLLTGHPNWDAMYDKYIDQFGPEPAPDSCSWLADLILREREAYHSLWFGQYTQAADQYDAIANKAQEHDARLESWYRHWRGLALLCADNKEGALVDFVRSANERAELGRPSTSRETIFSLPTHDEICMQAKQLSQRYRESKGQIIRALEQVGSSLQYDSSTNETEEALKVLGLLLGLNAERPDKAIKTGPDVVWQGGVHIDSWGFELKTGKQATSQYSKDDISQCHDHAQWLGENRSGGVELAIVGHMLQVSSAANPSPNLSVIELEAMQELLSRVKLMFEAIEIGDKSSLENLFHTWLIHYGLMWPTCVESLPSRLAVDLRRVR